MLNAAEANTTAPVAGTGGASGAGQTEVDGELFAKELGSRLNESMSSKDKIATAMEKLAGAFPGLTVTSRSMESFSEVTSYFIRTGEDSTVNISPDMMEQMAVDDELFGEVKRMLDMVMSAGKEQNLVNGGSGAQVTRNVNVTSGEIRYVEVQRTSNGSQLSASSLAFETSKFIADTLDQLLGSRQNTGSGKSSKSNNLFSGGAADFFKTGSFTGSKSSSFGFTGMISSSQSWQFEGVTSANLIASNQILQSRQSSLTSMDVIIEQWEMEGGESDLFTYMQVMGLCDPLVFDLGDEGINLTSAEDGVYYDIKGDGTPVKTAFIQGNNAFLYLDDNGNGVADDANELFGDHGGFKNGFEKLAQYDDNGDGVIDENDEVYSQLRLWRDLNGDGVNQASESLSLAEAGIKSINLRHDNHQALDAHGNVIGEKSTFTRTDGSQGLVADVWLRNL